MKAQLLPHKCQTAGLVAAGIVIIAMIALTIGKLIQKITLTTETGGR